MNAFVFANALALVAFFGFVQNIDNFVFAVAYRWQNKRIDWPANCFIAAVTALFTELAMLAASGTQFEALRFGLDNYTEILGRGLLVMIGVWTLVGCLRLQLFPLQGCPSLDDAASVSSPPAVAPMKCKEACFVGIALAADNVGPSFAFGLVNHCALGFGLALAALTAVGSLAAMSFGQSVGAKGRKRLHCLSPKLVAGCLILAIGLFDPADILRSGWHAFG
jgi:putative Mn2+ efflux pump MntP